MDGVLDMERLLGRVALDSAGPREVMALGRTLGCLPGVREAVGLLKAARWLELSGTGGISTANSTETSTGLSTDISTGFDAM